MICLGVSSPATESILVTSCIDRLRERVVKKKKCCYQQKKIGVGFNAHHAPRTPMVQVNTIRDRRRRAPCLSDIFGMTKAGALPHPDVRWEAVVATMSSVSFCEYAHCESHNHPRPRCTSRWTLVASNANVKTSDKMYRSAAAGKVFGKTAHHFHFRREQRLIC